MWWWGKKAKQEGRRTKRKEKEVKEARGGEGRGAKQRGTRVRGKSESVQGYFILYDSSVSPVPMKISLCFSSMENVTLCAKAGSLYVFKSLPSGLQA